MVGESSLNGATLKGKETLKGRICSVNSNSSLRVGLFVKEKIALCESKVFPINSKPIIKERICAL